MKTIVIVTIRPWNIKRYKEWKPPRGFKKYLIDSREKLTYARLKKINPRYVFFPHWSWRIPPEIHEHFECVGFHETDVPFGRGGSPLQNLIVRGIYKTKISAIRVVHSMDAGAVYLKYPINLKDGSAQELFERISTIVFGMITRIIKDHPQSKAQKGEVMILKRRKPEESRIPAGLRGRKLYDFIRMLDADEYPRAFILYGDYILEFFNAEVHNGTVRTSVRIRKQI
ncbi:MAG: methionyl-tRNA formyltransferase [bacterium]|nr:methionyl-tRNA formyltransferase [bacterium]